MLSRSPISLAQLNAGNNSEKRKNEIRQLLHSLYRSKKLTIFTNTENSKTNESSKFIDQFNNKFNIKNPNNKNIELVN